MADLPAGWASGKSEKSTADDQSTSKIEPAACQKMYDEMTEPAAAALMVFTSGTLGSYGYRNT